jgi:hypothetical protein
MLVEFRPDNRLRSGKPVDFAASVGPVVEALRADTSGPAADLSRVRVVCDWVQYRDNFRDIVDVRPILAQPPAGSPPAGAGTAGAGTTGAGTGSVEIAVDVRRGGEVDLEQLTAERLAPAGDQRLLLEDWHPGTEGLVWGFNALYWSALALWEKSTGRGYEQALPGGESDARNRAASRELVGQLFAVWDRLADSGALPEELYVLELGVGNGGQAKVFLDEFRAADLAHGREYYRRLHYLMCDYSQHVLDLARETVAEHLEHVSSFALDATRPTTSLGFLRYKIFLVYISNVYDNLPTDEVAQLGGRTYRVQTRAYLPAAVAGELAASVRVAPDELPALVRKLLRLGPVVLADALPEQFGDVEAAVQFWRRTWAGLKLEERYVPLAGLDLYRLAPSVSGEMLRPLLESGADLRMHVSNGAVASFTDSLRLLHPFGRLICHDIFVTDAQGYRTSFRGPGKYDGSVVNWVNGSLLAHVGRRHGFDVHYAPFAHRGGGHIVTMTAQVRE